MPRHTDKKIAAFFSGLPMLCLIVIYLVGYYMFDIPFEDFVGFMLTTISILVWLLVVIGLMLVSVAEEDTV